MRRIRKGARSRKIYYCSCMRLDLLLAVAPFLRKGPAGHVGMRSETTRTNLRHKQGRRLLGRPWSAPHPCKTPREEGGWPRAWAAQDAERHLLCIVIWCMTQRCVLLRTRLRSGRWASCTREGPCGKPSPGAAAWHVPRLNPKHSLLMPVAADVFVAMPSRP